MGKNKLLKSALWYRRKEFSVIPCKPKTKEALISWQEYQERKPTEEEITKWWTQTPDANIGIVLGKVSGLITLEVDDEKAINNKHLPITPQAVSGGKGLPHLYFRYLEGMKNYKAHENGRELYSIRGNGQYVLVPPSIHPSGKPYTWAYGLGIHQVELAELPEWIIELVIKREKTTNTNEKTYEHLFKGEVKEGGRNNVLTSYAGKLKSYNMNIGEAKHILKSINRTHCIPPLEEKEVENIIDSVYRYQVTKHKKGQKGEDSVCGGNFRDTLKIFLSSLDETPQKVMFQDVIDNAKKFLYITADTEYALKMALGSVVANYNEDDPLWMLIVAPPSSAKTEMIQILGGSPFAWNVSSFTSKTLASGERNNPQASLLKRIGAFGLIFLKDLTTILELNALERGEIFSQLREVYDGSYFKTFGNGVVINWKGKIGIVGACTPIIEKYGDAFKVLGERFLMCRISDVTTSNEESALNKALEDQSDSINSLRESLKTLTAQFLQGCLDTALKQEIKITQEQLNIIKTCAKFIAKTRAVVVRDSYSRDDILVKPFQEAPMRVAKQLKNLLKGLCVVDGITAPKDIHFYYLFRIALDNIPSLRKEIIEAVPRDGIFRADLIRKLGYGEGSRHFRRLMEDLTKLEILTEKKEDNRVSVFPSCVIHDFFALFDKFSLENVEENGKCPEKYPPTDNGLYEEVPEVIA